MDQDRRFWPRLDLTKPVVEYGLLTAITIIALALRLYRIGEWSFWGDELISIKYANSLDQWPLSRLPFFYVFTRLALDVLGTSEWSARLFPAIIGTLSIPAFYFPIRKIFDREVALISGLLLAISPWHLYWSQNARFYTLVLLFYTLSLLWFYIGIKHNNRWYLLAAMVFLGLAARERLFSVFLFPIFSLYLLIAWLSSGRQRLEIQSRNLLLLIIPGAIILLFLGKRSIDLLIEHFNLYQGVAINTPFWILAGMIFYLGVPLVLAGLVGMLYLSYQRDRSGLLLMLATLIPLIATVILSNFEYTANRYLFVTLTSWIVLASVGVRELFRFIPVKAQLLAAIPLLMLVMSSMSDNALYYLYQHGNRTNWKAAFQLIELHKKDGDLVATAYKPIADYYLQEPTINITRADLSELTSQNARIWIIQDTFLANNYPAIRRWIIEDADFIADFDIQVQAKIFQQKLFLYNPSQDKETEIEFR